MVVGVRTSNFKDFIRVSRVNRSYYLWQWLQGASPYCLNIPSCNVICCPDIAPSVEQHQDQPPFLPFPVWAHMSLWLAMIATKRLKENTFNLIVNLHLIQISSHNPHVMHHCLELVSWPNLPSDTLELILCLSCGLISGSVDKENPCPCFKCW